MQSFTREEIEDIVDNLNNLIAVDIFDGHIMTVLAHAILALKEHPVMVKT